MRLVVRLGFFSPKLFNDAHNTLLCIDQAGEPFLPIDKAQTTGYGVFFFNCLKCDVLIASLNGMSGYPPLGVCDDNDHPGAGFIKGERCAHDVRAAAV